MTMGLSSIVFATPQGDTASLADYVGQVVLVVNVASKCGLTPQYEALQALYADKRDEGFTVLAFPANDFFGQEPGTDEEIASFCSTEYAVTFPVLSKISVTGDEQHPLFGELNHSHPEAEGKSAFRDKLRSAGIQPTDDPEVLWNFEKFLIARDGTVVGRFSPDVAPDDPKLVAAVTAELQR
jgi:glutathione peroxidase